VTTRLLFRKIRHKAIIKPVVSLLRTRLVRMSPRCWTIFRSFEIILKWELSIGLEFKLNALWQGSTPTVCGPMFYAIHCFKNIQFGMNYIWKNTSSQRAARALVDQPE